MPNAGCWLRMGSMTTSELFDERGPEANNRRAAQFESQVVGMSKTLGWTTVCHNVDVFIKDEGSNPSRGIDVLWGLENPQTGEKDGIFGEAKVHKKQAPLSTLQDEVQTVHDKMVKFSDRQAFSGNEYIRKHVDALRWGQPKPSLRPHGALGSGQGKRRPAERRAQEPSPPGARDDDRLHRA